MKIAQRLPVRTVHLLILGVIALPYFTNLGGSSLWDANEAFYAETPREMIASGDYIAPTFNFQPRPQKPPLTYWAIALAYKIFGVREFSVRLPGALAAVGVILFTYGIALNLAGRRQALLAAVIAGTTGRVFIVARRLPIDVLLLFFLLATAYFIVRGLKTKSRGNWALAYIFAAFGFLTKGPIAWLVPGASYLVWSIWTRRFRLAGVHAWMGAAIVVAIVAPWYLLVYDAHGWTYIAPFFLRDNIARFASEDFGPSRGIFYYVTAYLGDFFPWSLFTPLAVYALWKNRNAPATGAGEPDVREPAPPSAHLGLGFPLVWCAFVFLFFSLSRNKQEYYIGSVYPMMAVLIGSAVSALAGSGSRSIAKVHGWTCSITAVALLAFAIVLPLVAQSIFPGLPDVLRLAPSFILFVTFTALAWNIVRGQHAQCFGTLAMAIWGLFACFAAFYLPAVERFRPVRDLCGLIDLYAAPGDEAGYFRATTPSMVYYLRRPIFEEYDAEAMARRFRSPGRVLCLMTKRDYDKLLEYRDLKLSVLDRRARLVTQLRVLLNPEEAGDQDLLLVSDDPKPGQQGRIIQ